MGITVKEKKVIEETIYTCDVLFKDIPEEEVGKRFDRVLVSKEAMQILPACVRNSDELVRLVAFGCGTKAEGFNPSDMNLGIWVLEVPGDRSKYQFNSRLTNSKVFERGGWGDPKFVSSQDEGQMQSLQDAEDFCTMRMKWKIDNGQKFWIFKDGKVVKIIVSRVNTTIVGEELPV